MEDTLAVLRRHGIRPTPQRMAVAECVLGATDHPSADAVRARVLKACPWMSRGTVYNTLNLLVEKGLLRTQLLKGGMVVFDPRTETHHHFIDEKTGRIYDIPWDAVKVTGEGSLQGFDVREYQVVMRGRRKGR